MGATAYRRSFSNRKGPRRHVHRRGGGQGRIRTDYLPLCLRVCFLKAPPAHIVIVLLVGRGLVPAPSAPTRPWYCPLWNHPVLFGDPVLDHKLGRKIHLEIPHPMIQLFPLHGLQMYLIVILNITHWSTPPAFPDAA